MPLTAYSRRYAVELDVAQWISRVEQSSIDGQDLTSIGDRHRRLAAEDLECPSCAARGAVLVSAGVNRNGRIVRQASFRFRSAEGGDAHHPLCDFYGPEEGQSSGEGLIDLRSARDAVTVQVRRLVCAGLERSAFTADDMRAMRLWFLDQRRAARITLSLDPRIPSLVQDLCKAHVRGSQLPFEPVHAQIPGFDWRAAAIERTLRPFLLVLEAISEAKKWPTDTAIKDAKKLLQQGPMEVFDASTLVSHVAKAQQLARFIGEAYGPIRNSRQSWFDGVYSQPHPPLLALAALLLFKSQWDVSLAAAVFASFSSHEPTDHAAGNLIGLNPFANWYAVGLIRAIQESGVKIDPEFDLNAAIASQVDDLKIEYASWRSDA